MLELRHISKTFGKQQVLCDVSAVFDEGKTNLVIGRNGVGKTVLMRCLTGLLQPDDGQVLFDGRDITALDRKGLAALRQEMGVVLQGSALFDTMSVMDNVLFPLDMFSTDPRSRRRERAEECLSRVGMLDARDKMPVGLDGGMQKRVAIARAIVLGPRYLLCDDLTSGLDPVSAALIHDLVHTLTHETGMTTIITTHDLQAMSTIGDNILFLHEGRDAWKGSSADILDSGCPPLSDFVRCSR